MTPTPINQADTAWMLVATALVPVQVSPEADHAFYVEPNRWFHLRV